jgi:Fuc2NAc and GlcNAc transferase
LIALVCCLLVIRNAQKWQLIANPNHRSSHVRPTPSGGGLGVVLAGVLTGLCLVWYSQWTWILGATVIAISSVLAAVGFIDDLRPMRASYRLGVQLIVSAAILFSMGGLPEIERFTGAYTSRIFLYAFLLLAILWWINLFNFMDGIDGLAGSQAVFMLISGAALLAWLNPAVMGHPMWMWMLCIAAAALGFLFLNWTPAKIFMGDVGSVYLALMILSLALMSIRYHWISVPIGLSMWIILGAIFVVDATTTLLVRMAKGQRWYEAHRSHVYQRLSRRWGGHGPSTMLYMAVNVFWLLPLAASCVLLPQWSFLWVVLAYLPLFLAALALGAGQSDKVEHTLTGAL